VLKNTGKSEKHGDGSSAYIQKKYPAQGRTTISYKGGYEKG